MKPKKQPTYKRRYLYLSIAPIGLLVIPILLQVLTRLTTDGVGTRIINIISIIIGVLGVIAIPIWIVLLFADKPKTLQ